MTSPTRCPRPPNGGYMMKTCEYGRGSVFSVRCNKPASYRVEFWYPFTFADEYERRLVCQDHLDDIRSKFAVKSVQPLTDDTD
jgi:hypothetical protein